MNSRASRFSSARGLRECRLLVSLVLTLATLAVASTARAQISPDSDKLLHRLFASPDFEVKKFGPARWLDGGEFYTTLEPSDSVKEKGAKDIVRYETATGKREVLISAMKLVPPNEKSALKIDDYAWSKDKSRVLIFTNTAQVWRRNTRGDYWVLDLKSGSLQKLGGDAPASSMLFAKFSPDGTRVAYVRANNIYVEELPGSKIVQLTHDGSGKIINGTSDWVYEEELALRDCFRWSPDGRRIAYWQFDTSSVGIFTLIYNLGPPREIVAGFPYPGLGAYPSLMSIAYPIPGTTNSAVRVGVIDASGGDTRWLDVPGDPRNNYIARMEWAENSNELVIEHLNRLQNRNDVLLADASSGTVHSVFLDEDKAWVNVMNEITWLRGGAEFLWLSERDGWRHAYRVSRSDGGAKLITRGKYDVVGIDGTDEKGGWLYFIASPDNATQRYLYRARLDGSGDAERVSPANTPGTHVYDVSPDSHWAFHTYSRADLTPATDLVELPSHRPARMLEDNSVLRANASVLLETPIEFVKTDIGDGISLDAFIMKPPHFDPTRKYPVLVYVYGEPAGQTVLDAWETGHIYFARAARCSRIRGRQLR